ncbi:MAG: class I SAM-dependent methyltransferase [Archangiaceae bacterium]|nr:class I SAM-dependent methyltransferase [Archangiaceae bacterium]
MNLSEYQTMFEHEQRHFWFRGTRAVVFDQVRDLEALPLRVADVGCGTGGTSSQMPTGWAVTGVDFSHDALVFSHSRGQRALVRASAEQVPLRSNAFDLAFALDVVEHCRDDAAVAAELFRILKPGGRLVSTVPAYQALFGPHDRALQHHRRYRRTAFGRLVESAGFTVRKLTYFNTVLFPPSATVRLLQRFAPAGKEESSNVSLPMGPLNALLSRVFDVERIALRRADFPFGLSVLAVAQKP